MSSGGEGAPLGAGEKRGLVRVCGARRAVPTRVGDFAEKVKKVRHAADPTRRTSHIEGLFLSHRGRNLARR
jgi:hypothetical protein